MATRRLVIGLLLVTLTFLAFPHETFAATYFYDQSYIGGGNCSGVSFSAPVLVTWSIPVGGTIRRFDQGSFSNSGFVAGTGSANANLAPLLSVGSVPYTYTVDYYVVDSTSTSIYQTKVVITCGAGNVLGVQIFNNYGASGPATAPAFAGPPVPSGFVLRTITCDVAVFNAPDGIPLPTGEKIKAGQTWFVNPESVAVTTNDLYPEWTEIFTSSVVNGYIPTACVGQ